MKPCICVGRCLILLGCLVLFCNCASIISKSEWPVTIRSNPDQADVVITDVKAGKQVHASKTPTTVTLTTLNGYFSGKAYRVDIATASSPKRSTLTPPSTAGTSPIYSLGA